jgi:hypothetical protein
MAIRAGLGKMLANRNLKEGKQMDATSSRSRVSHAAIDAATSENAGAKASSSGTMDALLNEAQTAAFLNVSVRTLQQWRVSGRGPRYTKLSRAVRYQRADLEAFIAKGGTQSTTEADARKRAS